MGLGSGQKIHYEGHCSALRVLPIIPKNDLEWRIFLPEPHTYERYLYSMPSGRTFRMDTVADDNLDVPTITNCHGLHQPLKRNSKIKYIFHLYKIFILIVHCTFRDVKSNHLHIHIHWIIWCILQVNNYLSGKKSQKLTTDIIQCQIPSKTLWEKTT